jgi:hypothetical protein
MEDSMSIRARLAGLRLFGRLVRTARLTPVGEPVVLADGRPLVLPERHRHFRPLVTCAQCTREFAWLKERITSPRDFAGIYWPDQPRLCGGCATARVRTRF